LAFCGSLGVDSTRLPSHDARYRKALLFIGRDFHLLESPGDLAHLSMRAK
jgi:hypothetical protein